jgi:hypothetical protein
LDSSSELFEEFSEFCADFVIVDVVTNDKHKDIGKRVKRKRKDVILNLFQDLSKR